MTETAYSIPFRARLGDGQPRPDGDYEDCENVDDPCGYFGMTCRPCDRNYVRSLWDTGVERVRYQQACALSETFTALARRRESWAAFERSLDEEQRWCRHCETNAYLCEQTDHEHV